MRGYSGLKNRPPAAAGAGLFRRRTCRISSSIAKARPFTGRIGRTSTTSEPAWPQPPRAREGAPNVLVLLLDDVGFAQLGCFGSDIRTPTFDRLAANGLRYRDFHTTAICSPTRACLLTGRNHHSNGVGIIQEMATGYPGYNGDGPARERLPLRDAARRGLCDVRASASGTSRSPANTPRAPRRRAGRCRAASSASTGSSAARRTSGRRRSSTTTTTSTRRAARRRATTSTPTWPTARSSTSPTCAPSRRTSRSSCTTASAPATRRTTSSREWIERYRGAVRQGLGSLARGGRSRDSSRWASCRADTKLSAAPAVGQGVGLAPRRRAAALRAPDGGVTPASWSRPTTTSAASSTSSRDSASSTTRSSCSPPTTARAPRAASTARSTRTSSSTASSPRVAENLTHLDDWGSVRSFPNYSWGWAWAGNTPLRRWKRYLHQGGMSDPLIVHWPKGIAARGEVRGQYVARRRRRADHPRGARRSRRRAMLNGVAQRPIEGVSFAHTFDDAAAPTRKKVQYYEMIGSRALWADGWKAVVEQPQGDAAHRGDARRADSGSSTTSREDFSECDDLADAAPGEARRAVEQWWVEAGKYNVLPLDSRMQLRMGERKPRHRSGRQPARVLSGRRAAVRVHRGQRQGPLAHDHRARRDPGGRRRGRAARAWQLVRRLFALREGGRLVLRAQLHGARGIPDRVDEPQCRTGTHTLAFRFARTGEHRGRGTLLIDGQPVGEGEIPQTVPHVIETSGEGLCCGYDSGLPVTPDYARAVPLHRGASTTWSSRSSAEASATDDEAQLRNALTDQ